MAYMRRLRAKKVAREDRHSVMRERLRKVKRMSFIEFVVVHGLVSGLEEGFSAGSEGSGESRYQIIDDA